VATQCPSIVNRDRDAADGWPSLDRSTRAETFSSGHSLIERFSGPTGLEEYVGSAVSMGAADACRWPGLAFRSAVTLCRSDA